MRFIDEVIAWYQENRRDLPWRRTKDPYIIWLSEVILQQTRVDQGMPYFLRFAEKYPTVADFAAADEDEVLKLWQGLGYYSRGRNMHATARIVMEEHAGYFPQSYAQLIKLKGIGEYTAAAISSFTANEARAVVDGNVYRLLARYFGIEEVINSTRGKKIFTEMANELIDPLHPGLSNQAMMEFGALQCRPKNPGCPLCPLQAGCVALKSKRINDLPVKKKKSQTRNRYFNYIVAASGGEVLVSKRGEGDIWQNLYEFPLIETEAAVSPAELIKSRAFTELFGHNAVITASYGPVRHILSHQRLFATFITVTGYSPNFTNKTPWFTVPVPALETLAQPKLIFAFVKMFPTLNSDLLIF